MKFFLLSSKIALICQILIALCLTSLPLTSAYAKAGCCSKHGGVAGCDSATGRQLCKDGTPSPTCACDGRTIKAVKHRTTTIVKKPATVKTTTTVTAVKKASTKGCCARHGGVAKCDKASGYQMCKDGTRSTTCRC